MATSILASFSTRRTFIGGGAPKPPARPQARPPESFISLKQTAERMLQEQACVKSDLEISNGKLLVAEDQLRVLESKLQEACNENAMLKVKHKEDTKLWTSLESKMSATSAFFDQITETLSSLDAQVQQAESTKKSLEERLRKRDDDIESGMQQYAKHLVEIKEEYDQALHQMMEKHKIVVEEFSECSKKAYEELLVERDSALRRIDELEKSSLALQTSYDVHLREKEEELEQCVKELSERNNQVINELEEKHQKELAELSGSTNTAYEELVKEKASVLLTVKELEKANELLLTQKEEALNEMKELYERKLAESSALANAKYEELMKDKESALSTVVAANQESAKQLKLQLEAREADLESRLKESMQQNEQALTEIKEKYERKLGEVSEAARVKCEELLKERDSAVQSVAALEKANVDAKKQSDLLLEAKQAEVAKHMKELSQRNDQALNEIKRHYEKETKDALQRKVADDEQLKQQLESTRCKYEHLLESATQKISALEKACEDTARQFTLELEKKQAEVLSLSREVSRLTEQLKDAKNIDAERTQLVSSSKKPAETRVPSSDPKSFETDSEGDDIVVRRKKHEKLHTNEMETRMNTNSKKPEIVVPSSDPRRSETDSEVDDIVVRNKKREAKPDANSVETRMNTRSKKPAAVVDSDTELEPEHLITRGRKRAVRTAEPTSEAVDARAKKRAPTSEKRPPAKRKRVQDKMGAPDSDKRRKVAPTTRQARSSFSGENDLFGDCLDPYRDDPYAFG